MKRFSTLVWASIIGSAAAAQCTSSITIFANVVDASSGQVVSGDGSTFWVCSDFAGGLSGSNNIVFIEQGASVLIQGDDNQVRTKSGNTGVNGNRNTFFAPTVGSVNILGGANNIVNPCGGGVVFTYTNAPSPGCFDVGIGELTAMPDLIISPNPFHDMLSISAPTGVRILEVLALDLSGRLAARHSGPEPSRMDMSSLSPGTYLIQVVTDRGIVVRKVSKV